MIGVDSKTSVGSYVSNRYTMKINFVLDFKEEIFAIPLSDLQRRSTLYKSTNAIESTTTKEFADD